jgi:hypothetical protein
MRITVNGQILPLRPGYRGWFFRAIGPYVELQNARIEVSGNSLPGRFFASENIRPTHYPRKGDVTAFMILFALTSYACIVKAYELMIFGFPILLCLRHSIMVGTYEVYLSPYIHQKILTLRKVNNQWRDEVRIFPEHQPAVSFNEDVRAMNVEEIDLQMSTKYRTAIEEWLVIEELEQDAEVDDHLHDQGLEMWSQCFNNGGDHHCEV